MEPDPAADRIVSRKRGKHAAVFQLIAAGFGVFGHKAVIRHQPGKAVQTASGAHKAVKHTAGGKYIHRFLTPAAPNLQPAQTKWQGNAKVDIPQGHMALIVFVFDGVAALVIGVRLGQVAELLLFRGGQPGYMAKIQGIRHGSPLIRCAFCVSGRVCRFSRPTVPGHRLPAAGCCPRQSHTRR